MAKPKSEKKSDKKSKAVNTERTIMKEITFTLSDKDKAELGKRAGAVDKELADLKEEFADVRKDFKSRIDLKDRELKNLLRASRDGKEERMVEVTEVKDFDAVKVRYMFKGKVVLERDMEWAERQTEMKVDNGKSKKSAKDDVRAKMASPVAGGVSGPSVNGRADVSDVIKEETNKKTKKSAVDASAN